MASIDFLDYSKIRHNIGYFSSSAGEGDKRFFKLQVESIDGFSSKEAWTKAIESCPFGYPLQTFQYAV